MVEHHPSHLMLPTSTTSSEFDIQIPKWDRWITNQIETSNDKSICGFDFLIHPEQDEF